MSETVHRPGVREAFLVKRNLKLLGVKGDNAAAIVAELDALMGVDAVAIDRERQQLRIAYDACHLQIDKVEAVVRTHRGELARDWWTRFKAGWYRYADNNMRDNAKHEPFCCSKVPPGK